MTNNIFSKILIIFSLSLYTISAQDEQDVDAIEKARQAKEAAEKAAAEASAATEAAIEAAAQKAAKEAREEAKRKKEEEEARKIAEAKAAEEAELDAAATAAAEEAKRKMAEELGLEYEAPDAEGVADSDTTVSDTATDEFIAKEPLGYNVGLTGSVGFVNGGYIVNTPLGGSLVINTPFGFSLGKDNALNLNISLVVGSYNGEVGSGTPLNALLFGLGANATLFDFVFSESHLSYIGEGLGVRNFSGVSLERLLKKGLNLPVNVLIGGEGFLTLKADKTGNSTYWGGLGVRLDYSF